MIDAGEHLYNHITDNLDAIMGILPEDIRGVLQGKGRHDDLLEVILDLGRVPTARYTDGEIVLRETEVNRKEIQHVVDRVGEFDEDNRAGIARTLHRIGAIRNRKGDVVGLTCRVGRAVYGTIAIIQDIVESGKNLLLLGRPGVGKTTMLREAARVLAEKKRVVIVDTSNEIGGDGDIPHPAIGRARRMQVKTPTLQYEVMIEAVENHNPEVIVIDEIGRELEAVAARTIAERGVQLIGTAHGNTLDNLLLNPTLSDLVGGVESVTLSDEEARRRNTQKTILERRAPPTFDVLIEIEARQRLIVHRSVAESVDALLRGRQPPGVSCRYRDADGEIQIEKAKPLSLQERERGQRGPDGGGPLGPSILSTSPVSPIASSGTEPPYVYTYGINRNRLEKAAKRMQAPFSLVKSLAEADLMITTQEFYSQRTKVIREAEQRDLPIYVLRSDGIAHMQSCLSDIFGTESQAPKSLEQALAEAKVAIQQVLNGEPEVVLSPQNAYVRRRQHELARAADVASMSRGKEPNRRVRIFQP
ncbi:MAG: R3H domain-containing nucleic acid-binding protein [Anaerolineae bacterium]|jgi:stage III sporulation protein SpoIIIAA